MLRFDSKNSGTKLPEHMTLIFSADTHWKVFAAKKTVTPFVESVKNTQLSIPDDRSAAPYGTDCVFLQKLRLSAPFRVDRGLEQVYTLTVLFEFPFRRFLRWVFVLTEESWTGLNSSSLLST